MTNRVVGYIRVSTDSQADGGISLAAQRTKLEAYAVAMDLHLVEVCEDAGYSAKSIKGRPALTRALATLDSGDADGLLIVKLDRLTRSVRDLGDLVDRYFGSKFLLLSVGDSIDTRTAAGRLVLNVLTSVAQWEREATAERTRGAMEHLRSQGVRLGGEALGWRRSDTLDVDGRRNVEDIEVEADTVLRIRELHAQGLSLRGVAHVLTEERRPTKRGGSWRPWTVAKVLRRTTGSADDA